MSDGFLTGNPIAVQIIAAMDVIDASLAFGKWHRPDEKQKIADAQTTLATLRSSYPTTYAMTLKRLGRVQARKAQQS
jgi:hypothetical protein